MNTIINKIIKNNVLNKQLIKRFCQNNISKKNQKDLNIKDILMEQNQQLYKMNENLKNISEELNIMSIVILFSATIILLKR